ncbi:Disease resistance protein (TIR-NBS-LRR class) [Thalictrum thalictroides]|uniref:Disease resistance protein (TIR-NBS-LRR class) n=1 Tax=Thalictrum thalictroides TaxID=46969 RepID=A0A7J6VJK9_THATH|nr:Disease resistance protein (TIR-NBS-LRR class) [Thalictrum thalictroides]
MNVEEADCFFEGLDRSFQINSQYRLQTGYVIDRVIDIIINLIGKTTEENLYETQNIFSSMRFKSAHHRFPKAVTVSGWSGFGKERMVKYTTLRVMKAELFDTLIWMMEQEENLSLKKVLSDKISQALQDRNFLLVHNGGWGQEDLRRIGIPSIKGPYHSMILVASNNPRDSHAHFSFNEIHGYTWQHTYARDLVICECEDIVNSPKLRKAHINITPKAIEHCTIYLAYLKQYVDDNDVQLQMMRYWFAEGFIGDATLDLETIFKQGNTILEELRHRGLIEFVSTCIPNYGNIFPCTLLYIGYEKLNNPKTKGETDTYRFFAMNTNPPRHLNKVTTIIHSPLSSLVSDKTFVPENIFEKTKCVRVLSFKSTTTLSKLPSSILHLANSLRFLNLRNCKSFVQVPYLSALVELQILDLSNTSLEELPHDSFKNLHHLRLLDLTECVKLSHLPSSISCLLNLEQLLLGGCSSLNVLPSHILPLEKLQILDLSRTILAEIPEQFFRSMNSLKDLNLSFNSHLTSLPKSISNLINLKKLSLESCSSLRILTLTPRHLPLSLEELNLSNSSCLQGIKSYSSSSEDIIPNLRVINISGIQLQWISFKNYSSLENIILQSFHWRVYVSHILMA